MNNTEKDSNRRQEIQSSLNSIVESSDKWVERLRRREFRVRLAGSFLAGSLVLVAVGAAILGFFLSQGEEIDAFFEQQSLAFQFSLASSAAIAGLISGIATYFLLKRKHDSLLFGAVAFIVTNVVVSNFVVAIIVGVLVWLYVRHRTKKTYEHEMSKYEEQKRVFEQRKKDFIDTL